MGKYNLDKSKTIQNYITSLLDEEVLVSQQKIVDRITIDEPGLGKVHSQDVSNAITKLVDLGGAVVYTVFIRNGIRYIRLRRDGEMGSNKYVSAQKLMVSKPLAPPLSFKIKKTAIITGYEFAGDIFVKNLLEISIYHLKLEMKILTRADRDTKKFSVPLIRPYAKENFTLLQEATIKEIEIKAEFTNGYDRLRVEGTISEPDVKLGNVICENGDFDYTVGALNNFWRAIENFETTPTTTWSGGPTTAMLWAVSQASPMRRVIINGSLQLWQYNEGCCAGYASGGYMSDSIVTGEISAGSQQQCFTRNSNMGNWSGI